MKMPMCATLVKKLLLMALFASILLGTVLPRLHAADPPPGQTARVSVDWGVTKAYTTPLLFGSNDWAVIQNPTNTLGDDRFARGLAQTGISFVRLHNGGMSSAWTDHEAKTWDTAKIKAVYEVPYLQGKTILQNVPTWPPWMKTTDGLLDPSEYDAYAAFCADLVKIVNGRLHHHVRYWEPFNEEDVTYFKKGKFLDLCTLYSKVAVAMKAADPTIKVGGLAFTWLDEAKIELFLKNCGPNVDFISWHHYAGDGRDATEKIMARTGEDEAGLVSLRALASRYFPHRRVPLVWDEYSLAWTYQSPETRQWNNIGAVWMASALKHMADAGVEMANQWNLKDGFYGLMDSNNNLRPAAMVYTWGNAYLVGAVSGTASDQPLIEAMAVRQGNGKRSLLLINKAEVSVKVMVRMSGPGAWHGGRMTVLRLDESGQTQGSLPASDLLNGVVLAPYSLLLLRR